MGRVGYPNPMSDEEKERMKQMLLDGVPSTTIAKKIGRSAATVQKIKKQLGLMKKERAVTDECNADIKRLLLKYWTPKNPKKKPEPRKRDWWSRETGSHFRTPVHYPGKTLY